ncbi:UNKNOWN [Stylonychia lemnae]|uniref:non-specific serine/threonine protein kinase n=1 Tax=Stylonychia lemnae TaxID=5949 RepID=A0A078AW09_STYLE|nr:UNKNOWN [Stylonychia lemnae]|eukprot:CDW86359.1 UNKNOWN [Stylonychia lemnae]
MGICSGKTTPVDEQALKSSKNGEHKTDGKQVQKLSDFKVSQSDFISENKGRFRDYYSIGTALGTGAFGEVRKCSNRKTGAIRAVKIIRKDSLDAKEKARFFQEIEILRQLDHPNIVRLYEVFQDDKRYYLVTELCTGGELFDEITNRTYFSEDLKPENILMDTKQNNAIKVIDFGTSQKFDPNKKMNQIFGTAYYIAPEVLKGEYNEKCDLWSIGVILYILLSGKPPFDGNDDKEIVNSVRIGTYSMSGPEWKSITPEAKDLIKKMLTYDITGRITAEQAINHPWIKKKVLEPSDPKATLSALQNLRTFRAEQKMQQAAITFIVSQLASKEEMAELQRAFKALDKNSDGKLSRDELIEGYTHILGDLAEEEVDRIMKIADADGSGEIDYSEWVVATMDKRKLLTNEKLEAAFNLFDKDGGGSISANEIKEVLGVGKNIDEKVWNEIITEVDANGDGEISFLEFKTMMQKLLIDEGQGSTVKR